MLLKKIFLKVMSVIWHSFASQHWFIPFLITYSRFHISPLREEKKNSSIRILALNSFRYEHDLEILNNHPDVCIYILPHKIQTLINALFYRTLPNEIDKEDNTKKYCAFANLENQSERTQLVSYLEHFIPRLLKAAKLDGIMSCSFFYIADIDWQRACARKNIPYFALHKENMQDGVVFEQMVKRYSSMKMKFFGQRLFLYNHLVKKVILGAQICNSDIISVTGAARMDSLFRKVKNKEISSPKRQITLFSSHHCIGLLQVPGAINYFSQNKDEGFVEYFDLVHGHIIKFAQNHPDVDVYIKPKWGDSWIEYIKKAGLKMGCNADTIPNLHITYETPAQELIETSSVILGINSTTLLESLIVGRPVILPLFAEAAGKYYEKHVYFKEYENDAFHVVRSPDSLENAILDELEGKLPKRNMPTKMIEDYLGYCDDNSTNRIVEQMKMDIQNIKNKG